MNSFVNLFILLKFLIISVDYYNSGCKVTANRQQGASTSSHVVIKLSHVAENGPQSMTPMTMTPMTPRAFIFSWRQLGRNNCIIICILIYIYILICLFRHNPDKSPSLFLLRKNKNMPLSSLSSVSSLSPSMAKIRNTLKNSNIRTSRRKNRRQHPDDSDDNTPHFIIFPA